MTEYNVKIKVSSGIQESLEGNKTFERQWNGLMHIEGTSHDFHTSGGTPDQVIETIGIELISVLRAQYHKEKEQNGY